MGNDRLLARGGEFSQNPAGCGLLEQTILVIVELSIKNKKVDREKLHKGLTMTEYTFSWVK